MHLAATNKRTFYSTAKHADCTQTPDAPHMAPAQIGLLKYKANWYV